MKLRDFILEGPLHGAWPPEVPPDFKKSSRTLIDFNTLKSVSPQAAKKFEQDAAPGGSWFGPQTAKDFQDNWNFWTHPSGLVCGQPRDDYDNLDTIYWFPQHPDKLVNQMELEDIATQKYHTKNNKDTQDKPNFDRFKKI